MIAGQDALAQPGGGLLGAPFRARQRLLRRRLRLLVRVVRAVERGEALEVRGRPGVLALEEFVDFALRGGALRDGGGVGFFGGAEGGAGGADEFLWGGGGVSCGMDGWVRGLGECMCKGRGVGGVPCSSISFFMASMPE